MTIIKFNPRFQGAVQGHAINTARKFFPVLKSDYDLDDLLQEAYLVFMKVKMKYGPRRIARPGTVIDNPAWFMAVYSRSLHNRFINMAERAGRYISIENIEEVDFAEDDNYLRQVLRELPTDVKALLQKFLEGSPQDERKAYAELRKLFPAVI